MYQFFENYRLADVLETCKGQHPFGMLSIINDTLLGGNVKEYPSFHGWGYETFFRAFGFRFNPPAFSEKISSRNQYQDVLKNYSDGYHAIRIISIYDVNGIAKPSLLVVEKYESALLQL